MKKSIYERALDIIYHDMKLIRDIIELAMEQEKLLSLYKELSNYVDEQTYSHELPEITEIKIKIKELENDKI